MINKIGLRTIKTGIAVTLSVLISNFLHLEYPFFVAMTAIISMDKTALNSIKMGRNRICGTIIGASVGILLSYIDRGNPFLCGIGAIIMITICNFFKLQGAIGIGGIVMMAIMVHTKDGILFYAFNRTLDTIIGASVALFVNCTILPYYNVKRIDETLIKLWDQTQDILYKLNDEEDKLEIVEIHKNIREIDNVLSLYSKEIIFHKRSELIEKLQKHLIVLKQMMVEIDVMDSIDKYIYPDIYDFHKKRAIQIYNQYIDSLQAKYN